MDIRWLCEQEMIILRPFTTYRFIPKDGCQRCAQLAAIYGYETNDVGTWEGEGGAVERKFW